MDIRFENLTYLHLLWAVPLLFGLAVFGFARKRQAQERFATPNLVGYLASCASLPRQWVKTILLLTAAVFLVLGVIDPRWGRYYENIPRRGIDIMIVLDVSRSMLAQDLAPNRLERAKQYIRDMIDVAGGDRVGLVTFAGKPVLKCPLTVNYGAFRLTLDELDVKSAPRGGSLIGDGVRLAADSYVDEIKEHKAIVVITDGEDQESYPVEAAREAFKDKGIRVYTVGLGDEVEGARVPDKSGAPGLYMKYDGQEVWSKMKPQTLKEMAVAGGGAYIPAGTKTVDMGGLLYEERIAQQEQREFEASRVERYKVQYQWFGSLALLLLLIEMLISDRRPGRESPATYS
jgi:Ca-activated chloride channel family protein